MRQQGINGLRSVHAGSCHAWPLPADATCATVARQVFRDADMSVLSVCRGLTVWCRSGVVSLTSPEGDRERWSYADLVEAAEQTVRRYEELDLGLDLAAAGA
jgi:hypothetical protein